MNHPDWLNKGPQYNIDIYSRFHGSLFEDFITHARTDRYNLLCSLVSHDKKEPAYEVDEISIGDTLIPKHVIIKALESLGATLKFIEIWLKLFDENYDARRVAYRTVEYHRGLCGKIITRLDNGTFPGIIYPLLVLTDQHSRLHSIATSSLCSTWMQFHL